jgi:formate dehydrogenase major subunit
VQELFISETAKYADVVLPGASFLEKNGTFTNGERRVQAVHQVISPIEGVKVDGQIIVDIMNKMGFEQPDYTAEGVLREISQIVPFFAGITWENLGLNGKQWPVAKDVTDTKILHQSEFKRGLGYFEFHDWKESEEILIHGQDYPFILTTNRDLEHYNCGGMTRRTDNQLLLSEDVLKINPADALKNRVKEGDYMCVESPRGKVDLKVHVTEKVNPGVLSTTFHFPRIMVNKITSDIFDSEAMCPEYKVVAVRIRKTKGRYKSINPESGFC